MRFRRAYVACLLATTILSTAAIAQPETPPPPADATGKVEKVVVTAQRRPQQAQSVGIALTPVTGDTLRDRGITVINGLENVVPSLEVENQFGSGQVSFTIRGLGFRDYATNNTPTVGIYVDEVAYTLPVMTQGVLFDVDRVEVLRGPQGTLYGRNTTGGAVNIISRKPTPETSAGFIAEYGRFDRFHSEAYVNGAVGEGIDARLSVASEQGGAWQENRETGEDLGDADRLAGRALVNFELGDSFNLLLNGHTYQDQSDGVGKQLFTNFGGSDFPGTFNDAAPALAHRGQRSTSWGTDSLFAAVAGTTPTGKPYRDNQGWGFSATASAELAFADVTYIGAFEHLDRREYNDFDGLSENYASVFFVSDADIQTHELRIRSNGDGPLKWITGAYYASEDLTEAYNSGFGASFGPGFETVRTPYDQEVQTIGIFGQLEYALSEQLNAIAGLRWENEERDLFNLGTFIVPFGDLNLGTCTVPFSAPTCTTAFLSRSLSSDELTGKAALEWTPQDDVLLYASVSRGIKSGGFTAYNTLNPAAVDPFTPEELWAYELGFKSDLADDTVRLNGAVFYYDYSDQQVQSAIWVAVPPASNTLVGKIVNAPKSEVYGGELELIWKAAPELTITQALGYKHGEFKEFVDANFGVPFGTIDRAGQDIGFPELSYAGSLTYERQTNLGFVYVAQIDYSFRDEQSFPLLGPAFTLDSYWLANASMAFRPDGSGWEFAIWGRNIFDEGYEETRNTFVAGTNDDFAVPGMPATYGVRVAADF